MKKIFLILSLLTSLNAFSQIKEYEKDFKLMRGDLSKDYMVSCVSERSSERVQNCANYIMSLDVGFKVNNFVFVPTSGFATFRVIAWLTRDSVPE